MLWQQNCVVCETLCICCNVCAQHFRTQLTNERTKKKLKFLSAIFDDLNQESQFFDVHDFEAQSSSAGHFLWTNSSRLYTFFLWIHVTLF